MKNRDWTHHGELAAGPVVAQVFEAGPIRVLISQDGESGYWHMSISHASGRYPGWDEVADARYDLLPHDIDIGLILPPPKDYVNMHKAVLQLTEIRDPDMPIDRDTYQIRTRETLNMRGLEMMG